MATPTNSRLSVGPWGVRLTPTTNGTKSAVKTPAKHPRTEAGLSLHHVIGTTANSPNAVTTLPAQKLLAFTAGAAAVISTFDESLTFTQRFYRARPTAVPLNPVPSVYGPSTPTTGSSDFRAKLSLKDSAATTPFSPDYADSPGRSWTARERVKAATCVSFSPDGKYLAVGETGYKPRVLIFSTSKESSPDCPLTCLPDHSFGVRCVAFSPNSQYLASLGTANDGYLFIWAINNRNGAATLYASNKCTSTICQIAWMGNSLITVGTRHVKVWRVDTASSSPATTPVKTLAGFFSSSVSPRTAAQRILQGRNCLLGPLLEGTFTSVATVSSTQAIVCSESGDICLLDDTTGSQRFFKVAQAKFSITAATICPDGDLLVAGKGAMQCFDTKKLLSSKELEANNAVPLTDISDSSDTITSLAPLGPYVITIDEKRITRLITPPLPDSTETASVALQLPAHGGPVLGVRSLPKNDVLSAAFFTWSADGTILFWGSEGVCKKQFQVELRDLNAAEPTLSNELKVVRTLASAGVLIAGDKLGYLTFINENTGQCLLKLNAHSSEITDIAILESQSLAASCSRDRMVQIFQKIGDSWQLQQTLDEHVGSVTGLVFTNNGQQLISCSTDRTIVVREALSRTEDGQVHTIFSMLRTITLKASPMSLAMLNDRDDTLFVSTIDRAVLKYNLHTGHAMSSFKVSDAEGGDPVVLSSLIHLTSVAGSNILAGVSSTDKSLRLYDESGTILGRDWGHTEGITDLTTIPTKEAESSRKCLVTVAVDGTVFIWTFGARSATKSDLSSSMDLMGVTPNKDKDPLQRPPLRRVLSQSEMARFRHPSPEQEDAPTPSNPPKKDKPRRNLEKKTSRFSLAQTPKLEPALSSYDTTRRRTRLNRSPSPPSPNRKSPPRGSIRRKSSLGLDMPKPRARPSINTAAAPTPTELAHSTDAVCRALRTYRRKLGASTDNLPAEALRDLERELGLTMKAVGEKVIRAKGAIDENTMVRMIDTYSEKLIEMLGEKINSMVLTSPKEGSMEDGAGERSRRVSLVETASGEEDSTGGGAELGHRREQTT